MHSTVKLPEPLAQVTDGLDTPSKEIREVEGLEVHCGRGGAGCKGGRASGPGSGCRACRPEEAKMGDGITPIGAA